jgi:4'-phosphopantetheinyl transferase
VPVAALSLPAASPLPIGQATGGLEVWVLRLADVPRRDLDTTDLDQEERRRAARLVRNSDRHSFLAGHVLLRELLSRRAGCRPQDIAYGRERCPVCGGPNGRPVVIGPASAPQFSISRSGGLVVLAIASVPVGVDVEELPSQDTTAEVSALLHEEERRQIVGAAADERSGVFARLWTRREAYLKGLGTGIAHGLTAEVVGQGLAGGPGWTLLDLPVASGYAAAVAVASRQATGAAAVAPA